MHNSMFHLGAKEPKLTDPIHLSEVDSRHGRPAVHGIILR